MGDRKTKDLLCGWKKVIIYYILYTVIFTCLCGFIYYFLHSYGKIPVWKPDGYPILYPAFSFLGDYVQEAGLGALSSSYSFNIGLGNDIFSFLGNWYFEPLSFLSMIIPDTGKETAYVILIILRLYLTGAAFSAYCIYMKRGYFPTLIGTVLYTFSVYALMFGSKWPLFLVPMIYFPLLLMGVERILEKNRISKLFVLTVFLQAWTSYYFLFISSILGVIYYCIRFHDFHGFHLKDEIWRKNTLKQFGIIILSYLTGVAMACVVLIPNAFTLIQSNRGSELDLGITNLFHYGPGWLSGIIKYLIAPVKLWTYSPLPAFDLFIGIAPVSVFAVIFLLFGTRIREKLNMKIGLIFSGIFLLFPIFGYIFSGFSNIGHRWAYGLIFLLAFIFVYFLPYYAKASRRTFIAFAGFVILYGILAYREGTENIYVGIAFIVLIVSFVWLLIARKLHLSYRLYMSSLLIITAVSVLTNSYYLFVKSGYTTELADRGTLEALSGKDAWENMDAVTGQDASLYRVDRGVMNREGVNAALSNNYNGLSFYHNTMSQATMDYMQALGNNDFKERILNYGMDSRTYLNALAGVKYYAPVWKEDPYVPYGYAKNDKMSSQDYTVYENQYALPLVYTYDNAVKTSDIEHLNALEKQEAMLQAVVLDGATAEPNPTISYTSSKKEASIVNAHNVEINNGEIHLLDGYYTEGAYFDVSFDGDANAETYLRLKGLNIDNAGFVNWSFTIERMSDVMSKKTDVLSKQNPYNPGMYDYWINMGYLKGKQTCFRVYIPSGASDFKLDAVEVYCQGFENYNDYIDEMKGHSATDITFHKNTLTASVDVSEDNYLFFSIPYSEGWTLYVDGLETKLQKANLMYMAAEITAGNHEIQLNYEVPGLRLGMIISVIGVTAFAAIIGVSIYRKKQHR